jgi:hypothetical protein
MKPEIEAKFLHIDTDEVRARLKAIDATCKQPMKLMRRVIFDNPVKKSNSVLVITMRPWRLLTLLA